MATEMLGEYTDDTFSCLVVDVPEVRIDVYFHGMFSLIPATPNETSHN
jgi:hypothetical protein